MMFDWIYTFKRRVLTSWPVSTTIRLSQKLILPGFDGQSVFNVARFFYEAILRGSVLDRAAAISFKFILSVFPAIIVILTLIPYIPVSNFQDALMHFFERMMPGEAFEVIESTLDNLVNKKHNTLLSIGFILALFFASNTIQAILDGLNASFHLTDKRSTLGQRLVSLGLIIFLPILMALGLLIFTFSGFLLEWLHIQDILGSERTIFLLQLLKWILSAFLIMTSISILYNTAAGKREKVKLFSAGASLSTIGVLVVSALFATFVNNFGTYNKLYGSLGAILVTLLWVYINFITILVGFELNTSIAKAKKYGRELFSDK